jgi:hypothetical protein
LRKDKREKINMQKAGVRWGGHSDGDTQQPHPPPASLLYTVTNKERAAVLRGHDTVVIGYRRNLQLLLSEHNFLGKAAVLHFALSPFCRWGLCPSQPADY